MSAPPDIADPKNKIVQKLQFIFLIMIDYFLILKKII